MPNPQLNDPNITTKEKLRITETNHWVGRTRDLIIIVRKTPNGEPKINIDKRFDQGVEDERGDRGQVRKIIKLALQQENINPQKCEVSVL